MVNDAAVGDIVLVSDRLARSDWAAVRDQVAVAYPSSADATAHRNDFLNLGAGLWVYDNEQWRSVATTGITRFLEPFTIAGYVVMAAAGLSVLNVFVLGLVQRKRERAALRAIGMTSGQEQAVIIANAGLLGLLVAGLRCLGVWASRISGRWAHRCTTASRSNGARRSWRCEPGGSAYSARPGRRCVSRDPCAAARDGRGAANQLTVVPQVSRGTRGAVVECRRPRAETDVGVSRIAGLDMASKSLGGNVIWKTSPRPSAPSTRAPDPGNR